MNTIKEGFNCGLLVFKHFGFAEVGLAVISFHWNCSAASARCFLCWTADAAQDIANRLRRALSMSPPSWAGGAYAARGHSATRGISGDPYVAVLKGEVG